MTPPLQLSDSGPKLTASALSRFEKRLGEQLPQDFKDFLLTANGGIPDRKIVQHTAEGKTEIQSIYGIGGGTALALHPLIGKKEESAQLLPIAIDLGGNRILLSLAPADYGSVYWQDHEEPDSRKGLSRVAKSFREFIDKLEPEPPPVITDPIEKLAEYGTPKDLEEFLRNGGNVEATTESGRTIAQQTGVSGNFALLKALVAHGASTEEVLHYAAMNSNMDIIRYLLDELHADINAKDREGYTPKQCAFINPSTREYLVSRGAK